MEKSINIKINFKYIWKGNIREAAAEGRRSPSVARPEAVLPFKMYFEFTFNSPCTFYVIILCTFRLLFSSLLFTTYFWFTFYLLFAKDPNALFYIFSHVGIFPKTRRRKVGWGQLKLKDKAVIDNRRDALIGHSISGGGAIKVRSSTLRGKNAFWFKLQCRANAKALQSASPELDYFRLCWVLRMDGAQLVPVSLGLVNMRARKFGGTAWAYLTKQWAICRMMTADNIYWGRMKFIASGTLQGLSIDTLQSCVFSCLFRVINTEVIKHIKDNNCIHM